MTYIQGKWKRIKNKYSQSGLFDNASDLEEELDQDVFDLIEAVRQQSLTDYHNHIVEKIKERYFDRYLDAEMNLNDILSLLQDTNPKE